MPRQHREKPAVSVVPFCIALATCLYMTTTLAAGARIRSLEEHQDAGGESVPQKSNDVRVLEQAHPIERQIQGGESHLYVLTLDPSQVARVSVEQRGVDLIATVFSPTGKDLLAMDSVSNTRGTEQFAVWAEASGSYKIELRTRFKDSTAGSYAIRLEQVELATPPDRDYLAAQKAFSEARALEDQWTAESIKSAVRAYNQSLNIWRSLHDQYWEALTLERIAKLYFLQEDYKQAEPYFLEALAIREKLSGPEHPDTAVTLTNLAVLYREKGEFTKVGPLLQRSLKISQKTTGIVSPDAGETFYNIAEAYWLVDDLKRVEAAVGLSLEIREKTLGSFHPDVALSLDSLATVYRLNGRSNEAQPMYERAIAIVEKTLGPDNPYILKPLGNLGLFYQAKGDYTRAEECYRRALMIAETFYGRESWHAAWYIRDLGGLYLSKKDEAGAKKYLQRALAVMEKAHGPDHPDVADLLITISNRFFSDFTWANRSLLLQRALTIYVKAFGPYSTQVGGMLSQLSSLAWLLGDKETAFSLRTIQSNIIENHLAYELLDGTEKQKLDFLINYHLDTSLTISLHTILLPQDKRAARLALLTVLRRKGRVLEAISDNLKRIRQQLGPKDQTLLDQLSITRSKLAALAIKGTVSTPSDDYRTEVTRLEEQAQQLESSVSLRSAEFRKEPPSLTIEQVQQEIPEKAALVELQAYFPFKVEVEGNTRNLKPRIRTEDGLHFIQGRYVAYVLRREGDPEWVDLGDESEINSDVARLRAALRDPERGDVKKLARSLDQKIMRPVRKLIGDAETIFLSPDGTLSLIPFGALVDENDRYLVERYSFVYLTSGRELLRMRERTGPQQGPIIVANPDFNLRPAADASPAVGLDEAKSRRSFDFPRLRVRSLPGTAEEAKALSTILPNARVLTEAQATEAAVKRVKGPSVLHIATHGFFLEPAAQKRTEFRGVTVPTNDSGKDRDALVDNPLLRSGLIFAGANLLQGGEGEDGILTALEAAGLDLSGTKLVVLSACDTGLGDLLPGDGVSGLRRALALAGAESEVMSLWQVSDAATRDLMAEYYRRLQAGIGRAEALRQVQLEMINMGRSQNNERRTSERVQDLKAPMKGQDRSHPYYWGAFIQSGDWRSLDLK